MKMKIILLSVCAGLCLSASAQVRLDPYYPYSNWTLGAGMGFSEIYGNLSHSNSEPIFRINLDRNVNPWVSFGAEVQRGALSDYETANHWTTGLSVYNQITTLDIHGKMSLGEIFNGPKSFGTKTLFGLYVGFGVGVMNNDVSNVTLKFTSRDKLNIKDVEGSSTIKPRTAALYMPFNLGFDLHLTRRCMFNINYQFCYAFSDYLDGYDFPQPTAHNYYNDMFSVLSFGLGFYIGHVGVKEDHVGTSSQTN
jgi:hypothetical protein